jgi:acetylornithine deacetylase/succinyl-diaminopimelate desuccinylase-like protein
MSGASLSQKKRMAARIALYSTLVILVVLLGVLGMVAKRALRHEARWGEANLSEEPAVQLLQEYIRIDTRQGKEIDGARFLAAKLAEAGIESTLEQLGDGRANLWAILEGKNPDALVLHHHIDVWAIDNPDQWLHPPFAAELDGPWLHGRGAFDMKSYGVAQLVAFLEAARSEQPLERSLILLATSDEESGSNLGTRWVLSEHPDLAARFWGVLTEGGFVEALSPDTVKYWGIETTQLQLLPVRVCSPSRTRLEELVADIREWPGENVELRMTDEFAGFASDYAPTRSRARSRRALADPERLLRDRREFSELPKYIQVLLHEAIHPSLVFEIDGGYAVTLTLFLPPGSDPAATAANLLPDWMVHGLSLTIGEPVGANSGSPKTHPLFLAAAESLRQVYPQTPIGSAFLPASVTDARFFRKLGIPTYGFSPFLFFTTDTMWVDRSNERIPVPGFLSGSKIYSALVKRLVSAGGV